MIREKKHFMKTCHAGGGQGFFCGCCTPRSPRSRNKRLALVRRLKHRYNQEISKLVQQELDK